MTANEVLCNLDVLAKANVYWSGKVVSRTCYREDGSRITLGVITAGTYIFDVGEREVVKLLTGTAEVMLPGEQAWKKVTEAETFEVAANSQYKIRTDDIIEYLCEYHSS